MTKHGKLFAMAASAMIIWLKVSSKDLPASEVAAQALARSAQSVRLRSAIAYFPIAPLASP